MNLTSALLKQIITQEDFESWGNLRVNYLSAEYQSLHKVMDAHIKNFSKLPSFDDHAVSETTPVQNQRASPQQPQGDDSPVRVFCRLARWRLQR